MLLELKLGVFYCMIRKKQDTAGLSEHLDFCSFIIVQQVFIRRGVLMGLDWLINTLCTGYDKCLLMRFKTEEKNVLDHFHMLRRQNKCIELY